MKHMMKRACSLLLLLSLLLGLLPTGVSFAEERAVQESTASEESMTPEVILPEENAALAAELLQGSIV